MSDNDSIHMCDGCGESAATARCAGCRKVWYCSKQCQNDLWTWHIFECGPRRSIPTAYYLAKAVYDDLLPTGPQTNKEWGLDKAASIDPSGPFKMFGLYVGLIKICDVKPQQLHKWRVQGTLIQEIKAIYEASPLHARGGYYPWFLEHQEVLENPMVSASEWKSMADAMKRRAWVALGNSATASSTAIDEFVQSLSKEQIDCFVLYAMLVIRPPWSRHRSVRSFRLLHMPCVVRRDSARWSVQGTLRCKHFRRGLRGLLGRDFVPAIPNQKRLHGQSAMRPFS